MWSSFSISRACIAAVVNYGLILSRVQRQAIVKVCGCRPMTTAPRPLGPASANLQGRKPWEMWRSCASDAMGISALAGLLLTASQEAVEGVADSIGRSRQTESASRQRRLIDKAVVQGGATASMVIAGREPAKTTSGPGLKSTVRGGARPHARKARHFGRRSVAPGTRLLGTGHKPGPVFRQTRKIATIGLNAAFIRGIPAQSAGGDQ
jgi:hypothetical protein